MFKDGFVMELLSNGDERLRMFFLFTQNEFDLKYFSSIVMIYWFRSFKVNIWRSLQMLV